jgi:GAF domain-containing protein
MSGQPALIADTGPIGVLAGTAAAPDTFTPMHQRLARLLAASTATVLERIRLQRLAVTQVAQFVD